MKTCQVNEFIDAQSEVFLGCSCSETENFESQYQAVKMALKTSGHKPYELKYDNQGGYKKQETGGFLSKIARHAISTQPYNGKSKTIESIFGRFQQTIMNECWYFTGQNITAKTQESRANMDYILDNKKNLPTYEEAIAKYMELRERWNTQKHFRTEVQRMEMYKTSVNEKAPALTQADMV